MSVHTLPATDGLVSAERTQRGRWMMVFVVLLCAAPVIASYFMFYVVQPRGQAYGELIHPALNLPPDLPLRTLDGRPVEPQQLKHQWLLVVVDGGNCVADCEEHLFMQRQLREMLGRERERVDKLWLVVDEAEVRPELRTSLEATPAMQILRADRERLAAWLQPAPGQSLTSHLYLVDPLGRWMWRSPARAEPQRVKRDLEKLLRASNSWDKPGRPE
ncbi:MAG: SCO family protein [Inhella sp.]